MAEDILGRAREAPSGKKKECGDQSFSSCKEPDSSPSLSLNNKKTPGLTLSVSLLLGPLFAMLSYYFFLHCFYRHSMLKYFFPVKESKTTQIPGTKGYKIFSSHPFSLSLSLSFPCHLALKKKR